jgi:hypothetical protein
MTEDRIRELLREMRDEPVPPATLERVHAAIPQGIAPRNRAIPSRVAGALSLAACILIAVFVFRRPEHRTGPTAAVEVPRPEPQIVPVAAPAKPAPRRIRRPVKEPNGGTLIRIETPDPDVVILLIGDE